MFSRDIMGLMINKSITINKHKLLSFDHETRKGVCDICGDVELAIAASRLGLKYWRCCFARGRKRITLMQKEHVLLEINRDNSTGVCRSCGNTRISKAGKKNGEQNWKCYQAVKKAAKPRTTNMAKQEHFVSNVDPVNKTGICAKCGLTKVVSRGVKRNGEYSWRCSTAISSDPKLQERQRKEKLKMFYGLTTEDYDKMLDEQDGKCFICRKPPGNRRLHVDHDHSDKKGKGVRALLCSSCNTGIGGLRDSTSITLDAFEYLSFYSSTQAESMILLLERFVKMAKNSESPANTLLSAITYLQSHQDNANAEQNQNDTTAP